MQQTSLLALSALLSNVIGNGGENNIHRLTSSNGSPQVKMPYLFVTAHNFNHVCEVKLKVIKITSAKPGSLADEAGLLTGDFLVSYDGDLLNTDTSLNTSIRSGISWDVVIVFIRDGQQRSCTINRGPLGIGFSEAVLCSELKPIPSYDNPEIIHDSEIAGPKKDILDGASGFVIIWGGLIGYTCLLGYLESINDGLGGKIFGYTILAGVIGWLASFIFKNGRDSAGEQTFKVIAFVVFIIIAIAISSMFSGGGGGGAYRVGDW